MATASLEKIISDLRNKELKKKIYRKNVKIIKLYEEQKHLKEIMLAKQNIK